MNTLVFFSLLSSTLLSFIRAQVLSSLAENTGYLRENCNYLRENPNFDLKSVIKKQRSQESFATYEARQGFLLTSDGLSLVFAYNSRRMSLKAFSAVSFTPSGSP